MRLRSLLATTLVLAACGAVHAQPSPTVTWRVSAGRDLFRFRDIARSRPPVDGSPVDWRGTGPIVTVENDRERELRRRRWGFAVSGVDDFVYETGVGAVVRPSEESSTFIEGHYDRRRYFRRPVLRVLRAGIGLSGVGEYRVLRHRPAGVELTETDTTGSLVGVLALRVRPLGRVAAEAEWGNAATLARSRQHHVGGEIRDSSSWGAGWFSDLATRVDVAIAARAALFVAYGSRGEGRLFDHRAYTDERRRVMVGFAYGR